MIPRALLTPRHPANISCGGLHHIGKKFTFVNLNTFFITRPDKMSAQNLNWTPNHPGRIDSLPVFLWNNKSWHGATTQILHRNYSGFSKAFAEHNSHHVHLLVYKMIFTICKFFLHNGGFIFWHSQWESNPCCRNENPMSWTARRWEHLFSATQRYPMFGEMSTWFVGFFV